MVLNDILTELTELYSSIQRSSKLITTIIEAVQFSKAKMTKVQVQYSRDTVH